MMKGDNSYNQIVKSTSLFGSLQVIQIIITIISTKFIAILLGPFGVGINGLFNSTITLISSITNLGLGNSAIKDVAAAYKSGDKNKVGTIVAVLRRLVWITGIFGALIMIILSPMLSDWTFENKNYTVPFILISITLLLNQIKVGQGVILSGTRQLKYMAKSSLIGSFFGLCFTVPLYFFFSVNGIVPAIIISSITSLVLTTYFSNKIKFEKVKIDSKTTLLIGKDMITMGLIFGISSMIMLGMAYLIRIYIGKTGGVNQVGLYSAGFAIITTYTNLIFRSMSTDFYPRLSGIAHDNLLTKKMINEQSEISILLIAPILIIFIVFIQFVVILFYSNKFIPINTMIQWAAIGMFFKAGSMSVAYILMAKGAKRLFFWNELVVNIYMLLFNMAGYKYYGLTGLGISFLAGYLVYFIQIYVVANRKFNFSFEYNYLKILVSQLVLVVVSFVLYNVIPTPFNYIFGVLIICISVFYSYIELSKRIDFMKIIGKFNLTKNKNE